MNWHFTLDTYDWPSITCTDPPNLGSPGCPGNVHRVVRFPTRRQRRERSELPAGRPRPAPDPHPGIHRRLRSRAHQERCRSVRAMCTNGRTMRSRLSARSCRRARRAASTIPASAPVSFRSGRALPAQPEAVRDYDGLEFRLRKRLSNRWSLDTSYLLSRLYGNWSGIASSDEAVGSLQPYSGRSFNLLYYSVRCRRQRELRAARHRSSASVQAAGDV